MKTIWKIFCNDIKAVVCNVFVLIIAIGLCIIPSLYAWFNIYSNWDPYANTSSIKVAVATTDKGYTGSDGTVENMGNTVIDQLRENKNLGWVFPENPDDAVEGVKSGDYYAAIIIGDDFSESMFNFVNTGLVHPSVTYYENEKKNAVASKITDTGRSTLQDNINTQFIDVVVKTVLGNIEVTEGEDNIFDKAIQQLTQLKDNLSGYDQLIDTFISNNNSLSENIKTTKGTVPQIQSALNNKSSELDKAAENADTTVQGYVNKFDTVYNQIGTTIDQVQSDINAALEGVDKNSIDEVVEALNKAISDMDSVVEQNKDLSDQLYQIADKIGDATGIDADTIKAAIDSISQLENTYKELLKQAVNILNNASIDVNTRITLAKGLLNQFNEKMPQIKEAYEGKFKESVENVKSVISSSVAALNESIKQIAGNMGGIITVMDGIDSMVVGMNTSLSSTKTIIGNMNTKLTTLIDKLNATTGSDKYELLMNLLKSDPDQYGSFLSDTVQVNTIKVYETLNYGTSVAPFYTTLALWVGGLVLVALIKVHVKSEDKPDEYKGAKKYQLFLGRYLLFFLMGQIQAVITVIGDLYLLKIQCLHPGLFFLAASVASTTFTLLIYTLTISFGDVGKALAVVMVVIQIAGSSGTYPIELLPEFFQNVYIYFPFPYAINAMRETISGMYANDYWIYLVQLFAFMGASLLVGLVIRKPFIKVNHFMEKRMHDTDMM